jgi:hypothetical protein
MPHIRPNCPEQSATNSPRQHHLKPNSLAARLTRDVLLLRSAGSSRRAISAALNLSHRRVQTILNGAAPWSGPLGADRDQAADLTVCRAWWSSNCFGLR